MSDNLLKKQLKKQQKHAKYLQKQSVSKIVSTKIKKSNFETGFDPTIVEKNWDVFWNDNLFFQPEFNEKVKCFCNLRIDYSSVEDKIIKENVLSKDFLSNNSSKFSFSDKKAKKETVNISITNKSGQIENSSDEKAKNETVDISIENKSGQIENSSDEKAKNETVNISITNKSDKNENSSDKKDVLANFMNKDCNGCLFSRRSLKKQPFVIPLPPPNITGKLHIGHSLMLAIQDSLCRYYRLIGHPVLFLPGTDHAGIATQTIVEKKIAKKTTRHELGRAKFIEEVNKWRDEFGSFIYEQMQRLGASLDLSRKCFTLDDKYSKIVVDAFCELFERKLVYRDLKIVSYCGKLKTTLSDLEVLNVDVKEYGKYKVDGKEYVFGKMDYVKYPIIQILQKGEKIKGSEENGDELFDRKIEDLRFLFRNYFDVLREGLVDVGFIKKYMGTEIKNDNSEKITDICNINAKISEDFDIGVINLEYLPFLAVGTTRIETILGDTGICLNPLDPRKNILKNCYAVNPLTLKIIPIIYDDFCDMSFGSGCLKVTPAHDFNDFEIGKRHSLLKIEVLDNDSNITIQNVLKTTNGSSIDNNSYKSIQNNSKTTNESFIISENLGNGCRYNNPFFIKIQKVIVNHNNFLNLINGLNRFEARLETISFLKSINLYCKEEGHSITIPVCSRSGDIIEPRIKKQWFMNCKYIAQRVLDSNVEIVPEEGFKIWKNWLVNIQEWCLSRQLWYGHRIPAFRLKKYAKRIGNQNNTNLEENICNNVVDSKLNNNEILHGTNITESYLAFKDSIIDLNLSETCPNDHKKYICENIHETENSEETVWIVGKNNRIIIEKAMKIIDSNITLAKLQIDANIDMDRLDSCVKFIYNSIEYVLEQDEDVLDTWFSSGLWPFATLNWDINNSKNEENLTASDFEKYFPVSILETGYDILFFWVARMCMLSLELTNQIPFKTILLHGIIRDAHGMKMSKSLGNVIDPLFIINGISLEKMNEILEESFKNGFISEKEFLRGKDAQKKDYPNGIAKCGSDALRMCLCSYYTGMKDINLDIKRVEGYRKLCNKLWNAYKFISSKNQTKNITKSCLKGETFLFDASKCNESRQKDYLSELYSKTSEIPVSHLFWIIKKRQICYEAYKTSFQTYNLMQATQSIHKFFLTEFCDTFIEIMKKTDRNHDIKIMNAVFLDIIKMLSVFMPFISEEIYQKIRVKYDPPSVCVADLPEEISIKNIIETNILKVNNNYSGEKNLRENNNLTEHKNLKENNNKEQNNLNENNNTLEQKNLNENNNKEKKNLKENINLTEHKNTNINDSKKQNNPKEQDILNEGNKNNNISKRIQNYLQNTSKTKIKNNHKLLKDFVKVSIKSNEFIKNDAKFNNSAEKSTNSVEDMNNYSLEEEYGKFNMYLSIVKNIRSICETNKIQKYKLQFNIKNNDLIFYVGALLKNCENITIVKDIQSDHIHSTDIYQYGINKI